MFPFPLVEHEIHIVDTPDDSFEVELKDMGSGFALLEPGAVTEFAFYDYRTDYRKDLAPSEAKGLVLTGAHRIRITRRIRVDDFEMLEVQSQYADVGAEYAGPPAFWNVILSETGLNRIVEVQAPDMETGTWTYKPGDKTIQPRLLRVGLLVNGHEPHQPPREHPNEMISWRLEVMNTATVSIGPKVYRCLRVYWTAEDAMLEYYVADTGRTVYLRRFNGPDATKYEELEGNPEIIRGDIVWRHWYDCLPEHALIIGC